MIKLSKINSDLTFSLASLSLLAVSGLLINVLIGSFYGSKILGLWGQSFSIYIIVSQFGSFGIQFSAQALTSGAKSEDKVKVVVNALCSVIPTSVLAGLILGLLSFSVEGIFDSDHLAINIVFVSFAIVFYSINKVLVGCLNGLRLIKWMSAINGGRGVLLLITLAFFYFGEIKSNYIALILPITEAFLFLIGIFIVFKKSLLSFSLVDTKSIIDHLVFGWKSLFSGVLIELNTKVDTLVIAYFLSDREVGRYTLAVSIAEGFILLLSVFRSNFNPIIAEHLFQKNFEDLRKFIRSWKIRIYGLTFLAFIVSIPLYYLLVHLMEDRSWQGTEVYFIILSAGTVLISGYFPFQAALLQNKRPEWFSIFNLFAVVVNFALNMALIPQFGLVGAATATSLSLLVTSVINVRITNRILMNKII